VDDDAQGQQLELLWERELDVEILSAEAWDQVVADRHDTVPKSLSLPRSRSSDSFLLGWSWSGPSQKTHTPSRSLFFTWWTLEASLEIKFRKKCEVALEQGQSASHCCKIGIPQKNQNASGFGGHVQYDLFPRAGSFHISPGVIGVHGESGERNRDHGRPVVQLT
jgi:hypothetical protein